MEENLMDIVNRKLTLTPNTAQDTVECVATCTVELNALETAALGNLMHPGFRLRCVLQGMDGRRLTTATPIFTYPRSIRIQGPGGLLNLSCVFKETLSTDLLNEDTNGQDEIRANFTLQDRSNFASVTRHTGNVSINIP
jgi:hypothetical protein